MKLKKETILELGQILKEVYGKDMSYSELEKLAHSLVSFYDLLLKLSKRKAERGGLKRG